MNPTLPMPVLTDDELAQTDPRLLEALASLNQVGVAINRISPSDGASVATTLRLIVESAIKVLPGASAVIYIYDARRHAFDLASRVSAGEPAGDLPDDAPRPGGIGARAIKQRRRVLSYEEPDLEIHPAKVSAGAKTMACFPLIVADQPRGVLYVYLHQKRRFNPFELLMLENFVNQAAMASFHANRLARIQRDLARKEDELNRLRRAGLLISSRLGLEETLEAILQMALDVTNAHYGIVRLVGKDGQGLLAGAVAGSQEGRAHVEALPIDALSIMGWVAIHREAVCIYDLSEAPWSDLYYPLDSELEMRAELAVPLVGAGGRLEGVLNLESPEVGAFTKQDRHLLQSLATQAVIAIQEVRLLDALQEVARLLLTHSCQQVLDRLVELAGELLNAEASAIWMLDGENLVLKTAHAGYEHGERLPLDASLAGAAVLNRAPVASVDVRTDGRFKRPDLAVAQGWHRALIVPLLTGQDQEALGAFSIYSAQAGSAGFAESEWDEKVLTCLAHYAVLAVQNADRQEALRTAQEQYAIAETFAAVGDIAANLLHNLNNKVGTIPVRVQGIQDKCQPALRADAYLATNLAEIERSACAAMESVRENLAHLHPIHLAPVDVAACVDAAIASVQIPEGIMCRCENLKTLPPVSAGQQSLTLVFTNLLENAVAALAGEGNIAICGAFEAGRVTLDVTDDGPGIPPELHDRIFEFNVSARSGGQDAARDRLGFGLWWVKTLMFRLGGSVSVSSGGRNGATFHLTLPVEG